jgi:hypothetical protein
MNSTLGVCNNEINEVRDLRLSLEGQHTAINKVSVPTKHQ